MSSTEAIVRPQPLVDWDQVERVFLDMDGTLLDLNFDNQFWLEHVPLRYAQARGLAPAAARQELLARYRAVEGTMEWYCLDYWTRELGLDIARLKQEVEHLIAVHPHVIQFLDRVRASGRRVVLVTNAHSKSLALKMERTRLGGHLDALVCAHELGLPKERPEFWDRLRAVEPFQREYTLLVDDSLAVLRSARRFGIAHLLGVLRPDSRGPARDMQEFAMISGFLDILPSRHRPQPPSSPTSSPTRDRKSVV